MSIQTLMVPPARSWCLCGVLALAGVSPAQEELTRPRHAGRIVHAFDFEQPVVGTMRLPEHWVRAQHDPAVPRLRPGFPIWNEAELDDTVAYAGDVSVRVPVDGGSAGLRVDPGVLPVFPGADYLVAARVRTEGVEGSRARLVARLLDGAGAPIPGSEVSSRLVRTGGAWTTIGATARGDSEEAAFLQIDLELVQAREYREPVLGEHQVWRDDHGVAAWFDDVTVMQLPRVELTPDVASAVFTGRTPPSVTIVVRDLTGDTLEGVLTLYDDRGRVVDRETRPINPGRYEDAWTPDLPALGWYRAVLELHDDEVLVGAAHSDLVWSLAPSEITDGAPEGGSSGLGRLGGGSSDRARFGLVVEALDEPLAEALPDLVRRAGVGAVTLPAWDAQTTPASAKSRAEMLGGVVRALALRWIDVGVAFSRVPTPVADATRLRPGDALALLAGQPLERWRALAEPMLDRLGPRVGRWRAGSTGDAGALGAGPLGEGLADLESLVAGLVTAPELSIAWRADHALRPLGSEGAPVERAVSLFVPAGFGPDAIEHLADAVEDSGARAPVSLVMETLPVSSFGRRHAVDDLVRRTVAAWGEFDPERVRSVAISEPWARSGERRPKLLPAPELAAWRNLVERLAERRTIGRFPGLDGIRCEILDEAPGARPGRGGVLVAWREPGHGERAAIRAPLGPGPVRVIDVYGNETVIEPTERGDGTSVHVVPVGDSPVFIEGIDVHVVGFVAGFRLEPRLIPSTNEKHAAELVLTNPWPESITGTLYVVRPGGPAPDGGSPDRSWRISPREFRFSIEPGEEQRLPLSIAFSPYEEAGLRELVAEARVSADREHPAVRLVAPLEVGLDYLALEATCRATPTPEGPNLIVEATVTNTGEEPALVELRAFPPGMPRMRLPAVAVEPGRSVVRRFMIQKGYERLRGESVSVNLSEVDRNGTLNRLVPIE